ncbi:hypothetical protein OCF84_20750 (plasmid) [Shewanella xiamenensis]|uniref:Uncharacterized protein n=1 Tax=Shewanella xiamenensis TaxID=332186 RepID=A0ABT6UFQ7_9GAMM|nr:hypothetical protein [Shewanella xiamenensis]MDI5833302.1 hypothetical protein [Shewanella xiamenensis]WHF57948.1 hypothetical protein OCF84_20750 [Shewanella xiamenensis]
MSDPSSVIIKWIMLINASAEFLVVFIFTGGMLALYIAFHRLSKLTKQGQMQSMVEYSPKSVFILFIVCAFCMHLAGFISSLDSTIFAGVGGIDSPDPLSWRADDSVNSSGGPEVLMMIFLKKVIQFFGLLGVGKGLKVMYNLSNVNRNNNDAGIGAMTAYLTGGIALIKIDKTVAVAADLLPVLDGLVQAFNVNY